MITDSVFIDLLMHLKQVPETELLSIFITSLLQQLHLTSFNPDGVLYVFLLMIKILERLVLSPL